MIGLFKQKAPGNIIVLLIMGLLLKMPLFLHPQLVQPTENDGKLYQWLIFSIQGPAPSKAMLYSVLAFFLVYVQALMLNYLMNEYRMTSRPTYLPGMAYLLITSLVPEWNQLSAPLVTNTLIIWMFIRLFRLYNMADVQGSIFNIGLLAGLSSYLYFPALAFGFSMLLGIMILKSFRLNEIVLFLVGLVTPYYFHAVLLFLNDRLTLAHLFPEIHIGVPLIRNSIWLAIATLLLALPFLIGGYYIQVHLRKMLIQVRKNWSILLLYLLLAFFVPFINNTGSLHTWVLVLPSFAAFHTSAYFYPVKKWIPMAMFVAMVVFILCRQYLPGGWH